MAVAGEEVVSGGNPADGGNPDPKPDSGQPKPKGGSDPEPRPGDQSEVWNRERTGLQADLKKERAARQELNNQLKQLKASLDREAKRTRVALGVDPIDEGEAETAEIRALFGKHFGNLSKLEDGETFSKLEKLFQLLPTLEQTTQHYWGRHATNALSQVEQAVSKELGGDLSPSQKKAIHAAYLMEAQTNEEFAAAHENDPESAIKTFAKQWVADWFEPVRRKATAEEVNRFPRVPGAKDRSLVRGDGKKIDVTDNKAVEDILVEGVKASGGEFGRR